MATTEINSTPAECSAPIGAGDEVSSRKGTPTWEMAHLYPLQGDWSEEEYLRLDIGRLVEYDAGCLEFLPMPNLFHQRLLKFLMKQLDAYLERTGTPGSTSFAPCPIRLWEGKYREPDLFYIRPERASDLRRPPDGVDLAMEIVSDGEANRRRDFETKRKEYAAAGIPEYWIVDPETRQISVLVLDESAYRVHGEFVAGQTVSSVLLPGFEVSVDAIFSVEKDSRPQP